MASVRTASDHDACTGSVVVRYRRSHLSRRNSDSIASRRRCWPRSIRLTIRPNRPTNKNVITSDGIQSWTTNKPPMAPMTASNRRISENHSTSLIRSMIPTGAHFHLIASRAMDGCEAWYGEYWDAGLFQKPFTLLPFTLFALELRRAAAHARYHPMLLRHRNSHDVDNTLCPSRSWQAVSTM